jgi:hypothetical protein
MPTFKVGIPTFGATPLRKHPASTAGAVRRSLARSAFPGRAWERETTQQEQTQITETEYEVSVTSVISCSNFVSPFQNLSGGERVARYGGRRFCALVRPARMLDVQVRRTTGGKHVRRKGRLPPLTGAFPLVRPRHPMTIHRF